LVASPASCSADRGARRHLQVRHEGVAPGLGEPLVDVALPGERRGVDDRALRHDGVDRAGGEDEVGAQRAVGADREAAVEHHPVGSVRGEQQVRLVDLDVEGLHELLGRHQP
jgi:hypothetical protein